MASGIGQTHGVVIDMIPPHDIFSCMIGIISINCIQRSHMNWTGPLAAYDEEEGAEIRGHICLSDRHFAADWRGMWLRPRDKGDIFAIVSQSVAEFRCSRLLCWSRAASCLDRWGLRRGRLDDGQEGRRHGKHRVLAVPASDIRIGYGISSHSGSFVTTSAAATPTTDGSV